MGFGENQGEGGREIGRRERKEERKKPVQVYDIHAKKASKCTLDTNFVGWTDGKMDTEVCVSLKLYNSLLAYSFRWTCFTDCFPDCFSIGKRKRGRERIGGLGIYIYLETVVVFSESSPQITVHEFWSAKFWFRLEY